jgi:hypothetical protein
MRRICAGAVVVLTCVVVGCGMRAQAITRRWQPLILTPAPVTDREKQDFDGNIVVVEGARRSALVRWTSYVVRISHLSPGRWHVTAATLTRQAVPDFDVR